MRQYNTALMEAMSDQQHEVVRQWLGSGAVNIFGRPFAGKDTQCRRLARWLDAPVIGGGDILRKRDDLPQWAREIMEKGDMFPTTEYVAIVTPYLGQPDFAGRPLVLSSVGRWRGEEESVLQATEAAGHPTQAVVWLELDEAVIWERWRAAAKAMDREQRADDDEEALKVRLQVFREKTLPVLDFYGDKGLLLSVDGGGTPDEVEAEILRKLYERASVA